MTEQILGYHETPIRVPFGHIDGYGYLWHGHALSYFEIARADLVRPFGLSALNLLEAGLAVPMLELSCEYKKPAFDDEELVVRSTLIKHEIPLPYLDFLYRIKRMDDDEEILRGKTRQMLVKKDGTVLIRIPGPIRQRLEEIWEYLAQQPTWSG